MFGSSSKKKASLRWNCSDNKKKAVSIDLSENEKGDELFKDANLILKERISSTSKVQPQILSEHHVKSLGFNFIFAFVQFTFKERKRFYC